MAEAAAQLQKGLDQLALLPNGPERRLQELEFYSALGAALLAVKGQASSETGRAYALALGLWEQLGSPSEFVHLLWGQSTHHAHRGELDLALRLEARLLWLSHQRNDSGGLVLAHASSGRTLMFAARSRHPGRIRKKRLRPMIRSRMARLFVSSDSTPTSVHGRIWGSSSFVSAFPTRHWHRATRQLPRRGDCLIRRLWP